jgi:large subunit ribosomal protein L30
MKLKVSQVRSANGRKEHHKRILASLGLGRIGKSRLHDDNAVIRGMIKKVDYLLKVETVEEN